jgi:hypothetical protein
MVAPTLHRGFGVDQLRKCDGREGITMKVDLIEVGDSMGFVLPEEILAKLKVAVDDTVFLIESTDGYLITSRAPKLKKETP